MAGQIDGLMRRMQEKVERAFIEVINQFTPQFWQEVDQDIRQIFKEAMDDFYSDYTQSYYDRRGSLYDIIMTDVKPMSLSIWFTPEPMTFHDEDIGEGGLYDLVFRRGYHGGAESGDTTTYTIQQGNRKGERVTVDTPHPNPGTPYWRKPYPYYLQWGRPAERADTPPLQDVKNRAKQYSAGPMKQKFINMLMARKSIIQSKIKNY